MANSLTYEDIQLDKDGNIPAITVQAQRITRNMLIFLIGFAVFLVIIDAVINYNRLIDIGAIRRLSNIAREDGLGTWFMATQTLVASLVLFIIYVLNKHAGIRKKVVVGWLILALFFLWMAADDASQIHERMGSTFKAAVEAEEGEPVTGLGRLLDFFPSYPWQLIFMPFFMILGLYMFNFLWDQFQDTSSKVKLLVALLLFVTAVSFDFIEGLAPDNPFNIYTHIKENTSLHPDFVDHFSKSAEEFMEMMGVTLLLSAFFLHLSRITRQFKVDFQDRPGSERTE